ncbi:MAG: hypothetical protein HYY04_04730 [Chloroflexi bacterium]|nr:hypothetical protein [Chloroflexota bacterium]
MGREGEVPPGTPDELAVGLVEWLRRGEGPADSAVGSLDPSRRAELLADLLGQLMRAAPTPIGIAIDDAEGVDGASLALLARVIAEPMGVRGLLLTTSGPAWSPSWPTASVLRLSDLGPDDLQVLLTAALGDGEIDVEASRALGEAACGNPLALAELVWSYRATGQLPKPRAGGVAGTILALAQARIDAVDEAAKRVLQVGAVMGPMFRVSIVGQVLGEQVLGEGTDVAGAVARLRRRDLLVGSGDQVCFTQAAIRNIAYEGMLLAERRHLHATIGRALEAAGIDDPHLLAHHYGLGSDDAAAVAALWRAAESALAAGDASSALDRLREAVRRLGDRDELAGVHRATLLGRTADIVAIGGDLDQAAATFAKAVATVESGLRRADLRRRQALLEHRRGDDEAALDLLLCARDDVTLAELDAVEPVEAVFTALTSLTATTARIHLDRGWIEGAIGETRQGLELLSHLSLAAGQIAPARQSLAETNLVLAEALLRTGDLDGAAVHADAARVAYGELHDLAGGLRADLAMARVRAASGNRPEARARLEAVLALARRLGDREGVAAAEGALSACLVT